MYEGCGSLKTCFGSPSGCIGSQDCNILAVVVVKGDTYMFQLSGKKTKQDPLKYVALALSSNEKMVSISHQKQYILPILIKHKFLSISGR